MPCLHRRRLPRHRHPLEEWQTLARGDRQEAEDLVKRMQEDLEYFRQHAMTNPNRSRDAKKDSDGSEPTDDTVAAEPEETL